MKMESPISNNDDAKRPTSSFILHPSSLAVLSLLARVVVGGTFILAATLKLISPTENFEAAVRAFQLAPSWMEHPLALVLPWLELFVGAFCLLGLYTRLSALIMTAMLAVFTIGLAQAMMRGLNLENCGCFAKWDFVQSPKLLLVRDAVLLLLTLPLLRKQRFRFSLEDYARR